METPNVPFEKLRGPLSVSNTGKFQHFDCVVDANYSILKGEMHCDVAFLIGKEKMKMNCHKIFLMSRSPVFASMFSGRWEVGKEIPLEDTEPEIFQLFLEFLYCDKFTSSIPEAIALLKLGHKYDVKSLTSKCEDLLNTKIKLEDAIKTFRVARIFQLDKLMERAGNVMARKFPQLSEDESFQSIDEETLIYLLSRDDVPLEESQILRTVLKWATKNMEEEDNFCKFLENIVPFIRFPLMDLEEFNGTVVPLKVLPKEDVINLFMYYTAVGRKREVARNNLRFPWQPRMVPVSLCLYEPRRPTQRTGTTTQDMVHQKEHWDFLVIRWNPQKLTEDPAISTYLVSLGLEGLNYDKYLERLPEFDHPIETYHKISVSISTWEGRNSSTPLFQKELTLTKGTKMELKLRPSIKLEPNVDYLITVKVDDVLAALNSRDDLNRDFFTRSTLKQSLSVTSSNIPGELHLEPCEPHPKVRQIISSGRKKEKVVELRVRPLHLVRELKVVGGKN